MKEKYLKAKNKILELNFKNSIEKQKDRIVKASKLKDKNYNGQGLEKQKIRDPFC